MSRRGADGSWQHRRQMSTVEAIVLAGGAARRMGGVDKLALEVGGSTLLDRVLRAVRPLCRRLAIVGPRRPTTVGDVRFVNEDTPGRGPAAGVMAGFAALTGTELAFVLAGDLPMVTTSCLARLVDALDEDPGHQAAAALDDRGAPNPLLAVYRCGALRSAASRGLGQGGPAARLLPDALAAVDLGGHATLNVNSPSDLRRAEALLPLVTTEDPVAHGPLV